MTLTLSACINDRLQTYADKNFNFSVEFPKNWSSKVLETWGATSIREASPDSGINIYVEGDTDNRISVIGQYGYLGIQLPDFESSEFVTKSGLKGELFSQTENERKVMYLVFDEGFHYANINVSLDCYKRNEKKIMDILKSINIGSAPK